MDIFTTQLTRLIQTPIKPTTLKVKALLKEAGAGNLKEDLDHLENHDYYFGEQDQQTNASNQHEHEQTQQENQHQQHDKAVSLIKDDSENEAEKDYAPEHKKTQKSQQQQQDLKKGIKHLDLYV